VQIEVLQVSKTGQRKRDNIDCNSPKSQTTDDKIFSQTTLLSSLPLPNRNPNKPRFILEYSPETNGQTSPTHNRFTFGMGAAGSIEGQIGITQFKHLREEYEVRWFMFVFVPLL
jgi:hypothetical protein